MDGAIRVGFSLWGPCALLGDRICAIRLGRWRCLGVCRALDAGGIRTLDHINGLSLGPSRLCLGRYAYYASGCIRRISWAWLCNDISRRSNCSRVEICSWRLPRPNLRVVWTKWTDRKRAPDRKSGSFNPAKCPSTSKMASGSCTNLLGATAGFNLYDKHHLVPFGEFLPFPEVFERFGLQALAQNAGRFSWGDGPQAFRIDNVPAFQLLICYEAIFPAEILRGADRPEWLLHLTNDAWFGDFSGPYQHLAQARIRAIEFGLPLARAANTGVSAMIDPYGQILDSLDLNRDGFVDARLPQSLSPTLYARIGDFPILAFILLLSVLGVAFERRNGGIFDESA